jgi:hypothetical protein
MNKKLVIAGMLPACAVAFSLVSASASAAIIHLVATGTVSGGTIYNGSIPVEVPVGTALTAIFVIDTDVFPTGTVTGTGGTAFNPDGGGGCRSVQLPQAPLLASMMSGTVTVGGVTLQSQAAGNQRNCDYVGMDSETGVGDALSVQQDAYDSQTVYYTDGTLTTESPTPTPYHITETRIQLLTLGGTLDNDPFSADEVLSELAQTFTINSFYGTSLTTEFGRGRYICPSESFCYNEPIVDGAQYGLTAVITGLEGTIVPAPATLGLFGTAFASLGLAARRRLRRQSAES